MKRLGQNWSDSLFWISCSIAGILVPVLIAIIVSVAWKFGASLDAITNGGQFAIYSIGMLVTALYIQGKASKKRLPYNEYLTLAVFVSMALALTLFVLAVSAQSGADIARWIVGWPTIVVFALCVIVAFLCVLADNKRMGYNRTQLVQDRDESLEALSKDFDKANSHAGERK